MLETIITMTSFSVKMYRPIGTAHIALFILLGFCGDKGWAVRLQKFRVKPESVEVTEGEDVRLRCVVENQQGKAQWTKDGFALGFERDVPGYPRYSYSGDPALGQHHLVISGVTLTEDGEYQCQVGPTDRTPPIWAAANVTVLLAPTSISLVGWSEGAVVEMRPGTSLTLECVVTNARPPPRLWWYKDGLHLESEDQPTYHVEETATPRRWSVQSQLVVTAEEDDDGKVISCEAAHPALKDAPAPLQASVTLSVMHPPSAPVISGYRKEEILRAGDRRTLSCRARGGNPQPSVSWYRSGELVDDTSARDATGTVNTLDLVVTSEEDGAAYECRVANEVVEAPLADNVTLTVYYSPSSVSLTGPSEIEEGKPVTFACETSESNPPSSLLWTVQGKVLNNVKERVSRVSSGGWVTSSELTQYVVKSHRETEVAVECKAVNPAIDRVVKKKLVIGITQPPGPPVLEGDLSTEVIAGSTLDLKCSSMGGHPPPTVRIYKEDKEIFTSILRKDNATQARGKIEVSPVDNGSKVTCVVTSSASRAPLLTSATLTVLFAPWEVAGSAIPDIVEEGQVVTLSCESSSSHPPANITWKSGETILQAESVHFTQGAFGGTNTRSEIQVRPTAEDNGRAFTCEADNGLGSILKTDVSLNVLHGPRWVVEPAPQLDVYEGADLVIIASAASNPGPPRYWWWRGEETLLGSESKLRLGRVTRQFSGNYTVTAYSQKGTINSTFFLNVQYGPEQVKVPEVVRVDEGESVASKCSARGNPSPHLTWTRETHARGRNSTAQTLSEGVGVVVLELQSATRAATGVYLCHASNVVASAPPARTRVIVSQAATVERDAAGSRGSWASVGENGRLMCRVRAAPAPAFHWSLEDGTKIKNSVKYIIHKPELVDGLVLWVSVLEVKKVTQQDYLVYSCTAKNPLGADSLLLALHPPARPHTPTNFTVTNVTDTSISLTWTPNYGGGTPLGYMLRYNPSDTREYQYVKVRGGGTSGTTLTGLTPGTEYTVTVQARNDHGSSAFVTPPLAIVPRGPVRDADAVTGSQTSSLTPLLLLVLSLAALALLAINFIVVTCFIRWRSRNSTSIASSSTKKISLDSVGETPGSSPEATHRQVLLSLTTLSSTSPPAYRVECQTSLDGKESAALQTPVVAMVRPSNFALQQGDRRNSSVYLTAADRVPAPPQDARMHPSANPGSREASMRGSPMLPNGRIPGQVSCVVGLAPEAEVCSVGSGSYDAVTKHHRRRSDGLDDQISLCSHHSDHSYVYSQDYIRQVSQALHLHNQERARRKAVHRAKTQQEKEAQNQKAQQKTAKEASAYPGLNPAGPYSISFSQDTPLGYATLGTRRPASSKLATIQRSRSPTASLRCTTPTPAQTPPCFSLNPDGGGGTVLKLSVERIVPEGEPSAQAKRRQSEPAVPEAVAEPRERTAAEDPPEGGPGRRSTDGGDQTEGGGHPTAQHIQGNSSFGHLPRAPEEILLDAIVGSIKAKKTGGLARDKPPTPPPRAPPAEPPQTAGEIQVLEEAGGITVTVESAPDEAN
ncbi:nephrin isoform X2 [Penaeus vannamei]|uniref:nephrin isoform X2 n=1 Tax=Penaeus vannamei TaxID=6689 RepID=UPI00387F65A6